MYSTKLFSIISLEDDYVYDISSEEEPAGMIFGILFLQSFFKRAKYRFFT